MTTQKSLAQVLDRCASRADLVDREPASSKQCWFLAGLMLKAGDNGREFTLNTNEVLTKRRASAMIDYYLGAK